MGRLAVKDTAEAQVVGKSKQAISFGLLSLWDVDCIDSNGNIKWTEHVKNMITQQGIARMMNTMFFGSAILQSWYVMLAQSDFTPASTATYAAPGVGEFTNYSQTRRQFSCASAYSLTITNTSTKASFQIEGAGTIYGAMLVTSNAKADTTVHSDNVLFCQAKFTTSKTVAGGDTLQVTITIVGADT